VTGAAELDNLDISVNITYNDIAANAGLRGGQPIEVGFSFLNKTLKIKHVRMDSAYRSWYETTIRIPRLIPA